MAVDFALLLQLASTLAAVVWVVSSVRATTLRLGEQIDALRKSVDRLYKWLELHSEQLNDHEGRLGRLEGRNSMRDNS